jgi:hypothetical protein
MGEVYRAKDTRLYRIVAIKVLTATECRIRNRSIASTVRLVPFLP